MENIYDELEKRKRPDNTWDLPAVIPGTASFRDFFGELSPMGVGSNGQRIETSSELDCLVIKNPILFNDLPLSFSLRIEATVSIPNRGRWLDYPFLTGLSGKLTGEVRIHYHSCYLVGVVDLGGAAIGFAQINLLLYNSPLFLSESSAAGLEVILNLDGLPTPVSFITYLFQEKDNWYLEADFGRGLGAFDIANFFTRLFGVEALLLPENSPINNFKLNQLGFIMGYTAKAGLSPKYIRAYLSTAEPWNLPLNFLTIDYLRLMWEMQWGREEGPWRPYLYTGQIAASLTLKLPNDFSLTFSGTATLPGLLIEAHLNLERTEPRTVGQLMGSAASALPAPDASEFTLASLDLLADTKQRELSLSAELSAGSALRFKLGGLEIALERLYAGADFRQTGNRYLLGGEIDFGEGDSAFSLALEGTYISAKDGQSYWTFQGGLSRGVVSLGALVRQMLQMEPGGGSQFDIVLSEFDVSYETRNKAFSLTAAFYAQWGKILDGIDVAAAGKICLRSDKNGDNKLSILLALNIQPFAASVQIDDLMGTPGYRFRFAFREHALEASYSNHVLKARFENVSLGDIIAFLIEFANPNRVVKFPPPWDFLNKIDLSKFSFVYDFNHKSLGVSYAVNLHVAGLFAVDTIGVTYYTETKKVMFRIDTDDRNAPYEWDLLESNTPGMLNTQNKFKLHYLAIASHFSDKDGKLQQIGGIQEAVEYLVREETELVYSDDANWLFAADFTINDVFRARAILLDPHLYGIVITVDGDKEPFGSFQGLSLELLYKKIAKNVGMFKATLVLPQKYRKFTVGYATVTIGRMSIELYTNGDFKIDLGFPHNRDFSQSFALEFGIFSGAGGFYFGLLSGLTYPDLPAVSGGYYAPVIALGIGISIGIGRDFDIGIVSAGFSLQAVGIFEGVIAFYNEETRPGKTYFKANALLGLTGRVHVKVDLFIITLSASVDFCAYAQVSMETGQPTWIDLDLELTLKASIKILFIKVEFEYHLSFHKQIEISGGNAEMLIANNLCRYIAAAKTELALDILPYFSLCEAEGAHKIVAAFLPVMGKEDFAKLTALLSDWVKASPPSGDVSYGLLSEFLTDNVLIKLQIRGESDSGGDVSGVVFAMPPPLELCSGDVCRRYWLDNPITDDYIEKLKRYFNTFDLEDMQPLDGLHAGQTPVAEVIFADYFNMLLRHIRKSVKEDCNDGVDGEELGAMVSRFMLQGLRLPEQDSDRTRGFFDVTGQQMPFLPGCGLPLKVSRGQAGVPWLAGEGETVFSEEQIKPLLPDVSFTWTDKFSIKPMDRFMAAPKLCSVREQYQVGENVLYRFGGDLSGFASPTLKCDHSQEEIPCDFGVLLPIEIRQTEHADVFSVIGLDPADRALLIPLFQSGHKAARLLYGPAPMDGREDTLVDLSISGDDKLIRQNLTRETLMFAAKNRIANADAAAPYVTDLAGAGFLRMLWQCSVVCGGYHLYFKPGDAPRVPKNIFSDEGTAKLWLYVKTDENPNCALSKSAEHLKQTATVHDGDRSDYAPALSPGCFGAKISFDGSGGDDGFHIFSYSMKGETVQSRPLVPVDDGYAPVWPLHKLAGSKNPYDAKEKTVIFRLRDVLGNFLLGEKEYTIVPGVSDFVIGAHEFPCTKLTWEPVANERIKVTLSCSPLDKAANDDSIGLIYRALCQADSVRFSVNGIAFPSMKPYLAALLEYARTLENPPEDVSLAFTPKLETITPLNFSLTAERDADTDVERAIRRVSHITPNIAGDLETFAKTFEGSFPNYKLARTGSEPEELYALRTGEAGLSIDVSPYDREISKARFKIPVYYAFRPLCNRAVTRECDGRVFADIDMEVWARHILEDMDLILSPAFTAGLADSPELSDLIATKELFAQNIARQLVPVEQDAPDAAVKTMQAWILEHLRVSLSGGYETSSAAQYQSDFRLTANRARLTLNAEGNGGVTAFLGKADTQSDVLCVGYRFASKYHTGEQPDLEVSAKHIEFDIADVDDGYQTSKWLEMVRPLPCLAVSLASDLAIPNPLRQTPEKSELVTHAFKPGEKCWELDYTMRIKTTAAEQDTLSIVVIFSDKPITGAANADDLFTAMARYETERTELLAALSENPAAHIAKFNAHAKAIAGQWGPVDAKSANHTIKTANNTTNAANNTTDANTLTVNVSMELGKTTKLHVSGYDTSAWTIEAVTVTEEITPGEPLELDVIIKNLSLYTQNVAAPTLSCTRNSKILGDLAVASDFIYRNEEVSLPALPAFSENGQLHCGTVVGGLNRANILKAQKLVAEALGFSAGVHCSADIMARYQYRFGNSVIRLPACMFVDVDLTAFQSDAGIVGSIMNWYKRINPVTDNAALEFEFQVNTGQRSLARFKRVTVGID